MSGPKVPCTLRYALALCTLQYVLYKRNKEGEQGKARGIGVGQRGHGKAIRWAPKWGEGGVFGVARGLGRVE